MQSSSIHVRYVENLKLIGRAASIVAQPTSSLSTIR